MHKLVSQDKKDVAQAMLRAGKSAQEVACTLEISRASVYRIRQGSMTRGSETPGSGAGGGVSPVARQIGRQMAGKYLALVEAILGGIEEEDILDAPLKERAIVANMFMDKAMSLMADGEEEEEEGFRSSRNDEDGMRIDESDETEETGGDAAEGFRTSRNDGEAGTGSGAAGTGSGAVGTGSGAVGTENPMGGDLDAESGGCEVGLEVEEN